MTDKVFDYGLSFCLICAGILALSFAYNLFIRGIPC